MTRKLGNFINLPWTLAYRHQQWQCKQFLSAGNKLLELEILSSVSLTITNLHLLPEFGQLSDYFENVNLQSLISSYSWLKIGSVEFKINKSLVLCKLNGSDSYQFGEIVKILCFDDSIYKHYAFICKLNRTKKFDFPTQSFVICERPDNLRVTISPFKLPVFQVYLKHVPSFQRSLKGGLWSVPSKTELVENLLPF